MLMMMERPTSMWTDSVSPTAGVAVLAACAEARGSAKNGNDAENARQSGSINVAV